jgi:diacylglycerol kinase (ATP)
MARVKPTGDPDATRDAPRVAGEPGAAREGQAPPSTFIASLNYAIAGLIYTIRTQRNMRIHFAVAFLVLVAGVASGVSRGDLLALLLAAALVIVTEMLNSALEAAIDIATTSFDPRAKIAKDVAAGAVLVCSAVALGVAYVVFADRLQHPTVTLLARVRSSPVHLTVIALFLVVIVVIAVKAATGSLTPASGGLPSGHAALAFSGATVIAFLTSHSAHSMLAASLAVLMAVLVAQTRVEAGIHSLFEVFAGGTVGVVVTVLVFQVWS